MKLVIACSRPNLIRGGQRHPAVAAYPLDHFSEQQLLDILGEPAISVVVGEPLSMHVFEATPRAPTLRHRWEAFVAAGYALEHLAPGPVVDQGAPSVLGLDGAEVTGADLLDTEIHTPAHQGLTLDPAPASESDIVQIAQAETVERMHQEEAEMAVARSGGRARAPRVVRV